MKVAARVLSASLGLGLVILAAGLLVADEPPPFKETPQEYGLVFDRPYVSGEQARLRARSGGKVFAGAENDYVIEREKAYASTGSYPADDASTVEAMVKKKRAVLLGDGTKIQFNRSFVVPSDAGFVSFAEVRILVGPAKDKVAFVGRSEFFTFDSFPLKAGDEAMLGKGRLSPDEMAVAVVGEVPAFNALLRSWRDGEPRGNIARARKAGSVWFQEPGTRVRIKAVACSTDRTDHHGLAGPAVSVELLDGRDRGKVGWAFPESVVRAAGDSPRGVAAKAAAPAGWVVAKSEKDGFVVELAGQPNLVEGDPGDGGELNILGYKARGLEMLVAVAHGRGEIPRNDKGKSLGGLRDRVIAKLGGGTKVEWQREESLGSLRGVEFGLTGGPLKGQGRAFAAGKKAYLFLVVADRKGEQFTREELRFLRSFTPIGLPASSEGEEGGPKPAAGVAGTSWGTEVDPAGDVEVRPAARKLTMKIPGTPHVLAPERNMMNAPRVVAPVRGDFAVTVRVDGAFQPGDRSTVNGLSPRVAAGLILWKDPGNYLVFQRRASAGDGKDANQAVLEELVGGEKGVTHRPSAPAGPLLLRLERTKGRVEAAFSVDGKEWRDLKPVDAKWAEGELQVGVVAVSTSPSPHEVTFDRYSVKER